MDPYLELNWRDVHHSLCTYARDALQPQVRPALFARVDERLIVESAEPLIVRIPDEMPSEGFIEIIDPSTGGKLVTVIEFLSPANKSPGPGQKQYLQKQRELREAGVSLVEIDLLYSNTWVLQAMQSSVPLSCLTPYRACVKRGWMSGEFELYSMPIQERLPSIKIPLREKDKDAVLDLQALIDQTYYNGAYDQIDYRVVLEFADMSRQTIAWMDQLLRAAGRR